MMDPRTEGHGRLCRPNVRVDLLLKTTLAHKKVRMNRDIYIYIYGQILRAIYTERGPNNKHKDVRDIESSSLNPYNLP